MVPGSSRYTFGLVIDQISSWGEYENAIIAGVSDFAKGNDINLICYVAGKLVSPYEWERSRNILLEFVNSKLIDGLIVLPNSIGTYANYTTTYAMLAKFRGIPLVTISESYHDFHSVSINNYAGMKQAVHHLIDEHGCRRLAFIKGPSVSMESQARYQAYLDALAEHRVPFDPALVLQGNYYHESGQEAVQHLLSNEIPFDAVVASNDNMALGVMSELRNPMQHTPYHVPVVGFDDSEFAGQLGLTTVRQSFYDEASSAAAILLRLLNGEQVPRELELPTELIVRSSCGCVPAIVRNAAAPECAAPHSGRAPLSLSQVKKLMLDEIAQIDLHGQADPLSGLPSPVATYQIALVDDLIRELEGRASSFLQAWAGYIFWAVTHRRTTTSLHDLLSCLRKHALLALDSPAAVAAAENLFHAARVQVSSAIEHTTATVYYESSLHTATLDLFSEELFVVLSVEEQMNIASQVLPEHGIQSCFISLYDNPDQPLESARVIMAFMEDGKLDTGEDGIRYSTSELLPPDLLERLQRKRHNIIIQALHHGDSKLGYAIFGFEHSINRSFEIIRHRLSIALKSALLMADTIRHTADLEQQVSERTKELRATNEQLKDEIRMREEAQTQLRGALQELALLNDDLRALSIRDELTGLYNRRGFMLRSEEIIHSAEMDATPFILLFADLDKLKFINDSYGHEEGDRAIRSIADVLQRALPEYATIARLAGDEFTAIVPMRTEHDAIESVRARILSRIDDYNRNSGKPYIVSISMGFSVSVPGDGQTLSNHMKLADDMMYEEKHKKRGKPTLK